MKSVNNIFNVLVSESNIRLAIHNASLGKKNRRDVQYVLDNIDSYIKIMQNEALCFHNSHHTPKIIYDGVSRKKRTIIVPTFREQIMHHMIVNVIRPFIESRLYYHSYGSLPNKGGHRGKKAIERWLRDYHDTKYFLKMDIRKFFDSIPHDILKNKLTKIIRDRRVLAILFEIIDVQPVGIPLGFYTSQWIANWYLTELDYFIKQKLHAKYYMRYMDDMVIFGANKRRLHAMRRAISEYLNDNLGLSMKDNWQVRLFKNKRCRGHDLDFMGFRFFRTKTILRGSIFLKAKRKAKRLWKKKPTIHTARQMLSYIGWFSATDTYGAFQRWIKPYVDIRRLKRIIARYDRRKIICITEQKQAIRIS